MRIIFEISPYILSISAIILSIISINRCNKAIKEAEKRLWVLESIHGRQ